MFNETEVTITKCDNGFILEWRRPHSEAYVTHPARPTNGKEIHDTVKKVLDAARSYLT